MYWNETPSSERYSQKVLNDRYTGFSGSDVFTSSHKLNSNSEQLQKKVISPRGVEVYNAPFARTKSTGQKDSISLKWRSKRVEEFKRQEDRDPKKPKRSEWWWYLDPTNACQGPFHSSKMQDWYMQGFFKSRLPIRCDENTPFIPLGQWFETNNPAFLDEVPPNWREQTQHVEKTVVAHAMEEKLEDKPSTDEGDADEGYEKYERYSEKYEKYSSSQVSEHHLSASSLQQIEASPRILYTPTTTVPSHEVAEVPNKNTDPGLSNDWWNNSSTTSFSNMNWQRSGCVDDIGTLHGKIMSSPKLLENQTPLRMASSQVTSCQTDSLVGSKMIHEVPMHQEQTLIPQLNPEVVEFRSELKSLGYDRVPKEEIRVIDTKSDPASLFPTSQTQSQYVIEKNVQTTQQHPDPPRAHISSTSVTVAQPLKPRKPIPRQPVAWNQKGGWKQAQSITWSQRIKPKRSTPMSRPSSPQEHRSIDNLKTNKPTTTVGHTGPVGGKIQDIRQGKKSKTKIDKADGGKKKQRKPPSTNLENPFGEDWQKMSSEFSNWCKEELSKLVKPKKNNKFTDFTDLIKFLMSLSSEEEARDMIIQYLGNTPKVQTFADGFLLRKCFTMDESAEGMVQKASSRSRRKKKCRQE